MTSKVKSKLVAKMVIFAIGLAIISTTAILLSKINPFQIQNLLPKNHPVRLQYEDYSKKFNDENQIYILVKKSNGPFSSSELLATVKEFGKKIKFTANAVGDQSLYNAKYVIYNSHYQRFEMNSFLDNIGITAEGQAQLESKFWSKTLIDEAHQSFVISLMIKSTLSPKEKVPFVANLMKRLAPLQKQWANLEVHYLGTEVANYHFTREMVRNQTIITPLILALIGLFFFIMFRSLQVVFWSLFTLIASYATTIIVIVLNEGGIGPYSSFALFFVLITSTSDMIHLFTKLGQMNVPDHNLRIAQAVKAAYKPCLLTTTTTAIGFLSLVADNNIPIRYFGIYCATGTFICYIYSFTLLPFILKTFNFSFPTTTEFFTDVTPLKRFITRFKKTIIAAFVLAAAIFTYYSTTLHVDDNLYRKFVDDHPLTKSVDAFSEKYNYVGSIDILISAKQGEITNEKNQKLAALFEKEIESLPAVSHLKSLALLFSHLQNEIKSKLPQNDLVDIKTQSLSDALYNLLYNYRALGNFLFRPDNQARTIVFLNTLNSEKLEQTIKDIKKIARKKEYHSLEIKTGGFSAIRSYINNSVIRSFLQSFLTDLLLIFFVFLFLYRSLRWSILAMIPNLYPLIFISGLMGLFKITWESNLVILACITLGIAVDDTIHFLFELRRHLQQKQSMEDAIFFSLEESFRALVGTTLVFLLCFPCFLLADLRLFIQVGVLILLSLLVGLMADMLLLPSILMLDFFKKNI